MRIFSRITHYALRITHYALRITHYALRITHYFYFSSTHRALPNRALARCFQFVPAGAHITVQFRGIAVDQAVVGHVPGDHRARADHGEAAYRHTRYYYSPR